MRCRARFFLSVASIVMALTPLPQAAPAPAKAVRNLAGAAIDPFAPGARGGPPSRAVVLLFVSTDCPVSNRYAPEIQRLAEAFAGKGVRFWLVYPNPAESPAAIRAHLKAYGYPNIALRDPRHELVNVSRASVTPEAAVFDAKGSLVYHGRIDDRFVELGRERPSATTHDLESALIATLAGKPVVPSETQSFGCYLADLR